MQKFKSPLTDFCASEKLTICFFRVKEVGFLELLEVQKSSRKCSHGFDFSVNLDTLLQVYLMLPYPKGCQERPHQVPPLILAVQLLVLA